MDKIKTIIVDDEDLARDRITSLLEDKNEFEVVAECSDGQEAVNEIIKNKPDLVFLDIQMPGMNGFDVIENLDNHIPEIIFVTAYDNFAIKAFEVNAIDYLLKPFNKKRFDQTLERAKEKINASNEDELKEKLYSLLNHIDSNKKDEKYLSKFIVKSRGRIFFVPVKEVNLIKAEGNYIELNTMSGKHLIRESISNIESKLDPEKFLRIHRSYIIKIDAIKELKTHFNSEYIVLLKNGEKVKSGRSYKDVVDKILHS